MKRLLTSGVVCVIAFAGCGGSDEKGSSGPASAGTSATTETSAAGGGGGQQLSITADASQLKFNTSKLTAKAGKVTITMTNPSQLQHNVAIKGGVDEKGDVVGNGGKSVVIADLKPGKYTFYCSVAGHEAAGMTGELDVS